MTYQKYIHTFICLYLCSIFHVISADQACDKSKCKGPLKYYEDLECIPTYSPENSCCPVKFNCDHLKGRSADKCYYKGHVYAIGESLRAEDAKPCDIGCTCTPGYLHSPALFRCAVVDCFNRPEPGCYLKRSHTKCCPGPKVCPQNGTEIARCEVDGKTYLDGQRFTPKSDPTLNCICSEGYNGENLAPFCIPVKPFTCDVELRNYYELYNNCTPAFYSTENPATDCNFFSRCQNNADRVIEPENAVQAEITPVPDPSLTCTFGQLTMKVGDQLNSGTYYTSVCLKCVCEVPPIPTCQRLPDNECDVTVHAKFDESSQ